MTTRPHPISSSSSFSLRESVDDAGIGIGIGIGGIPDPTFFNATESSSSSGKSLKGIWISGGPTSPSTPSPQPQPQLHTPNKTAFSRSSLFCTSLYISSSSSASQQNKHLRTLPFLPLPPSFNQSKKPTEDSEPQPEPEPEPEPEGLLKDFFSVTAQDASDGSFDDINCDSDSMLTQQLELQYLSDQLDIAITDNGEIPRLDVSTFTKIFPYRLYV